MEEIEFVVQCHLNKDASIHMYKEPTSSLTSTLDTWCHTTS